MSDSDELSYLADLVRDPAPLAPVPPELIDRVLRNFVGSSTATLGSGVATPGSGPRESPVVLRAQPVRFGPYRVLRVLDQGGMGVVYVVQDHGLERELALKTMSADLAASADARALFLREAQMMANLDHDNVVPVYTFGDEAGVPYLVMPLLNGESLRQRLARGPLEPAEVIRIGHEIATGLAAAHARGIIHRDLKPGNVWLDADKNGRARVLDFGLARPTDGTFDLTRSDAPRGGTPQYMSPEQANGDRADHRADLFALGATLYECATGEKAFPGKTSVEVQRAVIESTPPAPAERNPKVPAALSTLIVRLLAKTPDDRPRSASGVAAELAELAKPGAARPTPPRRRRVLVALALGVVLLAGGVGVWRAARQDEPPVTDPAPERRERTAAQPPRPVEQPTRTAEPLRVTSLIVDHFERTVSGGGTPHGPLGRSSVLPKVGDQVTVEAQLNRPAYAYLAAFAPNGKFYPLSTDGPTEKVDTIRYPGPIRDVKDNVRYDLDDGTGMYVFAVVASDAPLPPLATATAGVKWTPPPTSADEMYFYDGETVESLKRVNGVVRGDRKPGGQALGASGGVVGVGAGLRNAVPGSCVMAFGFGVGGR
jgi:predicted Ser/Thr protein kinase